MNSKTLSEGSGNLNGSAAKLPPEDLNGRPQHDTLNGEGAGAGKNSKGGNRNGGSGVRRIRGGRVIAVAAAVCVIVALALSYGLSPRAADEAGGGEGAVEIDVRKQRGDLPSPPGLLRSGEINYANATSPKRLEAAAEASGYATYLSDENSRATSPSSRSAEDPAVAELRTRHAEMQQALAEAQQELEAQLAAATDQLEGNREQAQASLDAPVSFSVNGRSSTPAARDGDAGASSSLAGMMPPLVLPTDQSAINPNEVQSASTRANLQTEKIAFLDSAEQSLGTYLRTSPTGPVAMTHELAAGSVIPGFTVTALNSDLPGKVVGRVSTDVYDSATGRHVLIPQGSVAVGEYSSLVSNGQNRLLIAWEMLTFPDGRSVDLQRQPGTDASGASGLADRVDYHWDKLLLAGGVSTAVAVGGQLAEGDDTGFGGTESVSEQLRELAFGGASDTAARIANKVIDRQLDVQPTITVRPGWRFNILLTRNLVLEPYVDNRGTPQP